jgi:uncharacterized protein (TIGR02646 family)
MIRIVNPYTFTAAERGIINALQPFDRGSWRRASNIIVHITQHLRIQQNNQCVYCEQPLDGNTRAEVDHIAARNVDDTRYPEFTFETHNLALACSLCNGSSCKHNRNTIETYDVQYSNCTFIIVHPYFDDPALHLIYVQRDVIRRLTPQGLATINMFHLDSTARTDARSANRIRRLNARVRASHPILANLIERVLTFIASS